MNSAPVAGLRGNGFERFLRHCARYRALAPRFYPRGVVKFRSLEEARQARAEIAKKNIRRLQGAREP